MRFKIFVYIIVFYLICASFIILVQKGDYSENTIKRYSKQVVADFLNDKIDKNKPYKVFMDNIDDDDELSVKRNFKFGIYNIISVSYISSFSGDHLIIKILYNELTGDCKMITNYINYAERIKDNKRKEYIDKLELLSPTTNETPPGYRNNNQ